ncbi:hypothetical protein P7K49_031823 [Saguinus oedipus]|uniref:Uncharacterized protein n=1 Tax=Saguinus oedipus TaxID=9490 RepID=A0ABQ9U0M1_SAGOE|nr:hypothetical protein P7K49_031823 [Saguinus oedipus]
MAWTPVLVRPRSGSGNKLPGCAGDLMQGLARALGQRGAPADLAPCAAQQRGLFLLLLPFGPIVPKLDQQVCDSRSDLTFALLRDILPPDGVTSWTRIPQGGRNLYPFLRQIW